MKAVKWFMGAVAGGVAITGHGATWYLDASVASEGDGTSWATAFKTIANALAQVTTGEEIWVAQGIYTWADSQGMAVQNHTLIGGYPNGGGVRDPEANPTILDGQSARRAFYKTGTQRFTLDGFWIVNCVDPAGLQGGAIYATEGPLTVANCIFSNNMATYNGGAICTASSGVENQFVNCRFVGNRVTDTSGYAYGGAVVLTSSATGLFENCSFVTNLAGSFGGAVSSGRNNPGGLLKFVNCSFWSNVAQLAGAAIYAKSDLDCSGGTNVFVGNVAPYQGGAIRSDYSGHSNRFVNCLFYGNRSTDGGYGFGGGIAISLPGTSFFERCTFHTNYSGFAGGAIAIGWNNAGGLLRFKDCLFSNNVAGAVGAAIYAKSHLDCSEGANVFVANVASYQGGAIRSDFSGHSNAFVNCLFDGNRSTDGGYGFGGAVCIAYAGTSRFERCFFVNNRAGRGSGAVRAGGIWEIGGDYQFSDCLFSSNVASIAEGGAIEAWGQLECRRVDFDANYGAWAGGAVCVRDTAGRGALFLNCSFTSNRLGSVLGGGAVYFHSDFTQTAHVENCTFAGNEAGSYGGAIRLNNESATLNVKNSIFWTNSAPYGGINIQNLGVLNISYSCLNTGAGHVDGGTINLGAGLMNANPLFARDTYPFDVHLKSRFGRWDPGLATWVKDDVTSPCLDAGDPTSDWSNEPAGNGERINLGRYGNTPEASRSSSRGGTVFMVR